MNLRFVEAFHWVVTLESVTLAATRLSLTQSAVSSRIATLEAELGHKLFDRRGQRMVLTGAGERFASHAAALLAEQRRIRDAFAPASTHARTLRIGANESVLHAWLAPFIDALGRGTPSTKIELTIDTTTALHEHLRRAAVDLCFSTGEVAGGAILNRAFPSMALAFVAARGRVPVAGRRQRGLARLAACTMITFHRQALPTLALLREFERAGVQPQRLHFTSSISAMTELARRSGGVATLPSPVAAGLRDFDPVDLGVRLPTLPVVASWWPDPGDSRVDAAIALARRHAEASTRSIGGQRKKSIE